MHDRRHQLVADRLDVPGGIATTGNLHGRAVEHPKIMPADGASANAGRRGIPTRASIFVIRRGVDRDQLIRSKLEVAS
jgi:hypothetical protein